MGAFFVYVVKASLCLALFYLFYRLLLSRETFHRFNRIALLSLLVLSCIVPLIEVSVSESSRMMAPFVALEDLLLMRGDVMDVVDADRQTFMWREALVLVYMLGVVVFFVSNVWSLVRMWMLIRKCKICKENGLYIVTHNCNIAPFSWMRFVVLSEQDMAESGPAILAHERAHADARHSIDLMVADVCIFFQWFNPAAWLLKQELMNIHEYEADESVIAHGIDVKTYQLLLIKKAVGTRLYSMANSFNHSSLKKRITMMMRKKSNPWARAKYLYVLPLVAISLAAFARPEISEMSEEISAVKVNDLSASMKAGEVKSSEISKTPMAPLVIGPRTTQQAPSKQAAAPQSQNTPVLDVVEEMPQFPGGQAEMLTYLMKNVKYPKTAHENGVQGRVIVSFVVAADGSVRDGKVMRSVDPELDAEALRVVAAMPKWQPGKQKGKPVAVRFSLPVSFRLSSDKAKTDDGSQSASASQSNAVKLDAEKTLILVDGKAITNEELRQITPDKIESVSVIKGDKGVAQYGEKAKNGVIIVTTKK